MSVRTLPPPSNGGAESLLETSEKRSVLHHLFDTKQLAQLSGWQPFREGVEMLPVYSSEECDGPGCQAALLRYAPGARIPPHHHEGFEHILVLDGSQQDERGTYGRGTCLISHPGSNRRLKRTIDNDRK